MRYKIQKTVRNYFTKNENITSNLYILITHKNQLQQSVKSLVSYPE